MPNEAKQSSDEYDASKLSDEVLAAELRSRNFIVTPPAHYNEATGLIEQEGRFFDEDTGEEVDGQEAYRRASGGF